ncbi:MAG: N-acetylgalactosamine 6-sulfate sulfatase, partial [Planctomycetota bacterium]
QFRLDHEGNLFDLDQDPGQRTPVNEVHPALARQLTDEVRQWKQSVGLPLPKDERPFPVGHASLPSTSLPARDAHTQGKVTRSNRYPNCSFLTNWTQLDDRVTWDVEVLQAADYQIDILYNCEPTDIGAELELSFLDRRLRATVTQPHASPLIGAEEDRVPRIESYVKDFHVMTLGTIHLPAGRGPLTLRATEIPGAQAIDLRSLVLTRREPTGDR